MKKNYIMGVIACAALTMTSCSNDEIGGNNTKQGDPIEFGVYLGRDAQGSRGTIITTDNLTKFGVTAYYMNSDIPDIMYNQAVIKNGNSWTYSPVKYWPTAEGDVISFYAYAPYTENSNGLIVLSDNTDKNNGVPKATISLPIGTNADLTQMVDFVADAKLHVGKTNGNGTSKAVEFQLHHEMTRIGLQANVSENVFNSSDDNKANKTKVVIRSLKLNKGGEFYTTSTYTFPQLFTPNGKWSGSNGTADLDLQSILNWSTTWTINSTDIISDSKKGIALEGKKATNLLKKYKNEQQYLFLIPSDNVDGNGKLVGLKANSTSATITYDIITEDSNLEDGYSKTSATKTVYLPAGIMQQGKAYNLTFTIAVDQVKLDATVEPNWGTDTNKDIDVPYTPDKATVNP